MSSKPATEGSNLLSSREELGSEDVEPKRCASCAGFPKAIAYILGNEFCERFSFYGMKAILVIYLTSWLRFDDNTATAIFHAFSMLCYFTPIFGGMLSDGILGKYKTILYLSMVYMLGNLIMSTTALPPAERYGPMIGLALIGIGTGGIKPCVAAFGGDQFDESQVEQLTRFFSIFYFIINVGSLLSMLLTPILRTHVQCFGGDCFPVAFGVPAALMLLSLILFVVGRKWYRVIPPEGNVVSRMFGCIGHALSNKCKMSKAIKRDHWLDYADDEYEPKFIEEVRAALRVLLMFIPLPIFWALFDQQGSRWTLQALQMNGDIHPFGHLQADQMQALNPILIILLIPLFEGAIYPLFGKCGLLTKPLQRMCVGMLLAAGAFVVAGFIQLKIDATVEPSLPDDQAALRFMNAAPCSVAISSDFYQGEQAPASGSSQMSVPVGQYPISVSPVDPCLQMSGSVDVDARLHHSLHSYIVITDQGGKTAAKQFEYTIPELDIGGALVSVTYAGERFPEAQELILESSDKDHTYSFNVTTFENTSFVEIIPSKYHFLMPNTSGGVVQPPNEVAVESGGVYTIVIHQYAEVPQSWALETYLLRQPNQVSILLQAPQYILITAGEVMFSVTGLHFAYSQAPASMKSVLQAGWLTTVAFGNLIVVIVAEASLIPSQAGEFFLFACLMTVDMLLFSLMAYFYVYVDQSPGYNKFGNEDEGGTDNPVAEGTEGTEDSPQPPNTESHM